MQLNATSINIIGGGVGGLTCALAFVKRGARVCVFEKAKAFKAVGAGIQITPNAMRVFREFGLSQSLMKAGVISDAVVPMNGLSGRRITRFGLTGQRPRYLFIHRAKLMDFLVEACISRGVELKFGSETKGLNTYGEVIYQEGGTQKTAKADITVFADGLHSLGRGIVSSAPPAFFTNQVAWRAIIPGEMPPEAHIVMGPGRHVVLYPLGDNQINLVAVQERESWAAEGWSHADDPANLQAAFADFHPSYKMLIDSVKEPFLWGLFRHEIAQNWYKERAVLLGDAAHPTLPFLAQGANMAIEDAYVLAKCCGEYADYDQAFATYQSLRQPRVECAIAAANSNARNYHLSGLQRRAAHIGLKTLGAVAPNAFLSRLSWLYDHDVTLDA